MTAPRQILPGTTFLVTRRCSERRFLLRPSEATKRTFLYVLAVAAKRFDILSLRRPAPGEARRGLKPRVACRDKWKRIEALGRLAEFASAYRTAFAAWRRGLRDALFPPGTYLLRVTHGVCCAASG